MRINLLTWLDIKSEKYVFLLQFGCKNTNTSMDLWENKLFFKNCREKSGWRGAFGSVSEALTHGSSGKILSSTGWVSHWLGLTRPYPHPPSWQEIRLNHTDIPKQTCLEHTQSRGTQKSPVSLRMWRKRKTVTRTAGKKKWWGTL